MGWLVLLVVVMLGLIAYMKFSEYIASQRMERERDEHKESWIKPDAERKPITVSSDEKRVEKGFKPFCPEVAQKGAFRCGRSRGPANLSPPSFRNGAGSAILHKRGGSIYFRFYRLFDRV